MPELDLDKMKRLVQRDELFRTTAPLECGGGTWNAKLNVAMNELCHIGSADSESVLAEVVGFDNGVARMLPFDARARIPGSAHAIGLRRSAMVPCGNSLLGRVIDGLGKPIDGAGPLLANQYREPRTRVPRALARKRVDTPLHTGQRTVDGLLTLGVGQRVGLFAGSGVGKSTLLGEIAKYSNADHTVIALVGERGREVRPFIEDCLGTLGLSRSVVVVSTSDESPLMRVRAVQTAVTIADDFRRAGKNVLFFLDSVTRLAMAQREIGLSLGEPPTSRGYTPSVFQLMASVLEQLGNSDRGSITAIVTVLVDGDDLNDPVADSVRSIVDGHIVLSRELAERGMFPAIDVGQSVSRTFTEVTSEEHELAARKLRHVLATYYGSIDLIRAGAYEKGTAPEIDQALTLMPHLEVFLKQSINEHTTFNDTLAAMRLLAGQWDY